MLVAGNIDGRGCGHPHVLTHTWRNYICGMYHVQGLLRFTKPEKRCS